MTLQEILKAKGMTDEDIEATIGEMKQNKIFTTIHENMDVRYPKLKADHESLTAQHGESTKLIEQFKAGAKDNEALQGKITSYEAQIATLVKQNEELKVDAAMDRRLMLAGARPDDYDYLKFQWRKKGDITLDEHGEINGADDAIAGLKTQHSAQFQSAEEQRILEPQRLPDTKPGADGMSRNEFLRKPYAERAAYAKENPEAYQTIMKH